MNLVRFFRRRTFGMIVFTSEALLVAQVGPALAVRSPFGIATPDTTGPAFTGPFGGFFIRVALWQSEFYRALTDTLGQMKHSGHAFFLLAGVSFLYGIFHAVGPGHGKAVITSYLLVSRQTVRRGIVISFAAALMQGLVAIGVVLVAAVILRTTAVGMTHATDWFEIVSYALVAAVGAWLLWSKATGGGHHHHHAYSEAVTGSHSNSHTEDDHHHHSLKLYEHSARRTCAHEHDNDDRHLHAPDPRLLSQPLTASRAWAATLAVGIRPCSGAIIVLVFALSQKLLLAGVCSVFAMSLGTFITVSSLAVLAVSAKDVALRIAGLDSAATERIMRVVEIGGALVVLLLGLTLLGGALQGGVPT